MAKEIRLGKGLSALLADAAVARMQHAIEIGPEKPELPPLIYAAVSQEGVARDVL